MQTAEEMIIQKFAFLNFLMVLFLVSLLTACTDPLSKKTEEKNFTPGQTFLGINSVSPSGGPLAGGSSIRILGVGFTIDSKIKLGTLDCTPVVFVSVAELRCTTPGPHSATETLDVTVDRTDGESATLTGGFTYRPAPTVTAISPVKGKTVGGTAITITGTRFVNGASVSLGSAACTSVTVVSPTQITCLSGSSTAGTVGVLVTNSDSQSSLLASAFDYRVAPILTSISPVGGNTTGGTVVTLTGSNFVNGATVTVGGNACTPVNFVSATSVTCTTAAHAAGAVDVVLTNPDTFASTLTNGFKYASPPTLTNISPAVGALAGGTTITLTGTGFAAGAVVKVDGVACGSVNVVSATSITCVTPGPHVQATVAVSVTNVDSQSASMGSGYNYMDPPSAPSSLTAAAFSSTSVKLDWVDNSNNESEFRIERSTDNVTFAQIATTSPNVFTYTNTGLTTDQIYYYRVRAYNLAANSAYTNVASATPIGIHLEVPIELMDTGVTADSATAISWLRTRTSLDTADYDGTVTYRFEAICSNTSAGSLTVNLVDSADTTKASIAISANAGTPTRYEAVWTPTSGANNYRFRTPAVASGTLICYTARMLVQQVNATITKVYIPLVSDVYNKSDSDNTITSSGVDITTSNAYLQPTPGHYTIWQKDTSRFADLSGATPWTLEVVQGAELGSGRAALYNRTTGTMVTGSEVLSSTQAPEFGSISFADNATGFTNLNDFELRVRRSGGGPSNTYHLFKAGLWVKLTNLNKAELYYRNARFINTSASLVVPHARVNLDLSRFLNIITATAYHEGVGSEPVVGTSNFVLRSAGTSDSATTGTDLAASLMNFNSTTTDYIRTGALTLVSGERYVPSVSVTSGTYQINNSFIVIGISK